MLDDVHDEGEETLTLTLSNPSSGRLTDAEATGTIKNRDPLPRALLARFGRTAAVHIVEQVEERVAAPRAPGFRGRFAGRELRRGMERDIALSFLNRLGGLAGADPVGSGVHDPMVGDVLTGSAFALDRETRHGGILSYWSRGARPHFSGREGACRLAPKRRPGWRSPARSLTGQLLAAFTGQPARRRTPRPSPPTSALARCRALWR